MDGLSREKRQQRIHSLEFPMVLNNREGTLMSLAYDIASFLRFFILNHHNRLQQDGYFNEKLPQLTMEETIQSYIEKYHTLGEVEPSQAVLFNFIENLHEITRKFNNRWKSFPQWYLEKILDIKPLPVIGDKVWVSFKTTNNNTISIPAATRFKVDREEDKTYYYALTNDMEVHNIGIEKMFLLINNKNKTQKPHTISSIDLWNLELDNNHVVRYSRYKVFTGVRVSSPVLFLKEGIRNVTITFYYKSEDGVPKDFGKTYHSVFDINISTDNGWYRIEDYSAKKTNLGLVVEFQLPDYVPPISSCTQENHSFTTHSPIINFLVNLNSKDFDEIEFEKFHIDKVKVEAKVSNISSVNVYNELGKIDNSKPFSPFGINADKGAWFTIGNYEMNVKDTKKFYINLNWENLGEMPNGLTEYYKEYNAGINNDSFEIAISYLSDFQWKYVKGKHIYPLFQGATKDSVLFSGNKIGPLDVEKMPVTNTSETDYEYSLKSRNGFINIKLVNPEIGFGEDVYRRVFTDQMMKNARKKQKYPTINAPLLPILKKITLDYEADEMIPTGTYERNTRTSIQKIVPLSASLLCEKENGESISFLPEAEERNLCLALSNIKEGMVISLFFEMLPFENKDLKNNGIHDQREQLIQIRMYMGNPHYWQRVPLSLIRKDETMGLLISGSLQVQIPEPLPEYLYDGNNLLWIKISYDDVNKINFPDIKNVSVNAAELELQILDENTEEVLGLNKEYGELEEESLIPGLEKISRISVFYGGREKESLENMIMRISEFSSHKGRAVTPQDYELMILQKFPEIGKVKYLLRKKDAAENRVYIVLLPKHSVKEKLKPLTPPHLLFYVEKYVRNITSSYVQHISVLNPVYEEIIFRCKIKQKGYFSLKRKRLLTERLNYFIAPWYYNNILPEFGYSINLEDVHNEILKEFGSEISFSDFSAIRIEKEETDFILNDFVYLKKGKYFTDVTILPSEPHSILIPPEEHIIYYDFNDTPDEFGIFEMKIGNSLIIPKNSKK